MESKPLLVSSESDDEQHFQRNISLFTISPPRSKKVSFVIPFKELARLVKNGNLLKLKHSLKERNIQLSDSSGFTVLHVAAASDNSEVMNLLLRHKRCCALLDRADNTGATPVMTAVQSGSHQTLELLCSHGADTTQVLLKTKETLLHVAAFRFDPVAAQTVLRYNSSTQFINCIDQGGDTPLAEAVRVKSPVFDVLLHAGADITIQNPDNGRTLLHVAVAYNRQSMLKKTMQHPDANIDFVEVKDVQGETALMIAVKLNKLELIKILTNAFSNLSGINIMEHLSILHIAISNNRPDILRHLINSTSSTSLDYLDNEFRTPIMYAAELDHAKCLQELIEYGADFHTKNLNSGETLMHIVAKNHSNSTLPFLMNITHISWFFIQKDNEGNTPYMTAIKSGNDKFLRESFKVKTVDLSECNAEGETSTYYTVKQGFPSVLLTLLLSPKYYQFAKSKPAELVSDKAEILKAEIRGDLYATDVYILLKKVIRYPLVPYFPPNLLAKTKENQTVFHACALGGSLECLEFLYEFYRLFAPKYFLDEFDEPGLRGDTPLLIAAQCGLASASCVFFFVSHGADLSATNNEGLSVVQAIFAYNPDATHLFISLFNSCVTAKKEHYYSEKMNIRIDFNTICPKRGNQMNVVALLFKESKEIDRRKILTHPVIVAFLQKKIHNLKSVLYIRFIVSIIITVTVSVLIPLLYIVAGDPKDNYGLPLFYVMKTVFIIMVAFCVFHVLLKIPAVMTRNMWFTDAVAFVPPTSMITLIACGKSYYIAPELSAMTILSCWMCVLVFSINIYSTFSYQSAVFFRLLHSISKQILVLTVIMFAFALSFFCLYNDDKRFAHFPTSFIYTFTVLLPGYLSDLPTFKKEYFSKTSSFHFLIECLVLSSFIIMASTGFVNMLVGLAVRGGRHLEVEGKIFQNHHQTHYMCEIEYWFRNHIFKWLMKKKMFSFLKECRRRITIDLVLDIYAEENKEICDDTMVRQFRSIVFKRYKVEKETEGEHVATENLEDVFNEPFGHLPGAKGSASTLDHKPTRYPTHPETSFTNLLD